MNTKQHLDIIISRDNDEGEQFAAWLQQQGHAASIGDSTDEFVECFDCADDFVAVPRVGALDVATFIAAGDITKEHAWPIYHRRGEGNAPLAAKMVFTAGLVSRVCLQDIEWIPFRGSHYCSDRVDYASVSDALANARKDCVIIVEWHLVLPSYGAPGLPHTLEPVDARIEHTVYQWVTDDPPPYVGIDWTVAPERL